MEKEGTETKKLREFRLRQIIFVLHNDRHIYLFFFYDSLKISQTIPIFKRTNELNAILYALLFFFISIKFIVLYILKKKKEIDAYVRRLSYFVFYVRNVFNHGRCLVSFTFILQPFEN